MWVDLNFGKDVPVSKVGYILLPSRNPTWHSVWNHSSEGDDCFCLFPESRQVPLHTSVTGNRGGGGSRRHGGGGSTRLDAIGLELFVVCEKDGHGG